MLYLILDDFKLIQYINLKAFSIVSNMAIQRQQIMDENVKQRIANLTDSITYQVIHTPPEVCLSVTN